MVAFKGGNGEGPQLSTGSVHASASLLCFQVWQFPSLGRSSQRSCVSFGPPVMGPRRSLAHCSGPKELLVVSLLLATVGVFNTARRCRSTLGGCCCRALTVQIVLRGCALPIGTSSSYNAPANAKQSGQPSWAAADRAASFCTQQTESWEHPSAQRFQILRRFQCDCNSTFPAHAAYVAADRSVSRNQMERWARLERGESGASCLQSALFCE